MKKRTLIFLLIAVMALGSVLAGCGGGKQELVYPDYPQASTDTESWEQWEDYDPTHITIDWYVDYSTFNWVGAESSIVSDMIEEKTGIKINFMKPVTDDGTMLNTLIAGGKLPDVITVLANGAERVQLRKRDIFTRSMSCQSAGRPILWGGSMQRSAGISTHRTDSCMVCRAIFTQQKIMKATKRRGMNCFPTVRSWHGKIIWKRI